VHEVDFYFDVMCPWAYQTSKWIREVRGVRPITVNWRFFSLEEVNREETKKHPWERPWSYGWSMLQVAALLRRGEDGNDLVDRFYEVAGRVLHEEGVKVHTPEGLASVLDDIGLDPGLVSRAVADATTSAEVLADHEKLVARGGYGVPTLVIDGSCVVFGPVITPAPAGEAAGRLWDAVLAWTEFPNLYELRRPKTAQDWRHIEACFAPYLNARDWRSVQNPVP
jgi:2-hydroxychromene-2-carboxylate isomerase